MASVAGFDWDEGNRAKCQKHGVSISEIESVFTASTFFATDAAHSRDEARVRAVGVAHSGRYVFVVFTVRERSGQRLIRPLSARYMHKKEIKRYEETRS